MGRYVLEENDRRYRFVLLDEGGHVICTSCVFPTEAECRAGIALAGKVAPGAGVENGTMEGAPRAEVPKFRIYQNMEGGVFFRLVTTAGTDLVESHTYPHMESLLRRIERMREQCGSPVEENE